MRIGAPHRRRFAIVSWLVALSVSLQSFSPAHAQTSPPESAPNATSISTSTLTSTVERSPDISDTTPLTLTPPITLAPPLTFAPLPSETLPVPPLITTSLTQVVTMPAPDARQGDVVVQIEPPKAQGKQEAVDVKPVSGDVVHPRKLADTTPATPTPARRAPRLPTTRSAASPA